LRCPQTGESNADDPQTKETIVFIMPNAPLETKDMPKYIVSVREIEAETGLNFSPF